VNPHLVERMKWFAKGFYTVEKDGEQLRFYNLQVDMRGIVRDGTTRAPTAGYFVLKPLPDGKFEFLSGAHRQR
jgi:inner membrane protein